VSELRRCVVAGAAVDDVWAVLEDVRQLVELSPSTTAVEGAPERLTVAGDTFTQRVDVGGRTFSSTWTVAELVPGRRLRLSGKVAPGVHVEMDEELAAVEGGTQVCLTMRYRLPFGPLGRLAGRLGLERRADQEAAEVLRQVARAAEGRRSPAAARG
jgi:hypothetical protein